MNWFKRKTWKKIGEVICDGKKHRYEIYVVMECILPNGDRRYKRIFVCGYESYIYAPKLQSQPEDPLKEINEILKH